MSGAEEKYSIRTLEAEADPAYVSLMRKLRYVGAARSRVRRSTLTDEEWIAAAKHLGVGFETETHPGKLSGWVLVGEAQVVLMQDVESGRREAFRI